MKRMINPMHPEHETHNLINEKVVSDIQKKMVKHDYAKFNCKTCFYFRRYDPFSKPWMDHIKELDFVYYRCLKHKTADRIYASEATVPRNYCNKWKGKNID
jgi:hypothetical protein